MNIRKNIRSGGDIDFSSPAELIGHPARAAMLTALLDREYLPMSMLALEAGISTSTASEHLAKLVFGGILRVHKQGKYRYYELASPDVALALEALAQIAPIHPIRSLRAETRLHALRIARSCYDHLAGGLGVAIMQSLIDNETLQAKPSHKAIDSSHKIYVLTSTGKSFLSQLGVELPQENPQQTRKTINHCMDWTEKRHHCSGILGAELLKYFQQNDWLRRGAGKSRAFSITEKGHEGFMEFFHLEVNSLFQRKPQ